MKIENSQKKSHFSKKKYHFFSLIFHWKKWLFWRNFPDFFSSRKIFFVQLFVSKKSSNYFLKTNFWSRFFSNICAVWFPVDWACFWINPGLQKSSISIFVRGGPTVQLPPQSTVSHIISSRSIALLQVLVFRSGYWYDIRIYNLFDENIFSKLCGRCISSQGECWNPKNDHQTPEILMKPNV